MSKRTDNGRQTIAYAIEVHGVKRTPCEKKRREKNARKRRIAKESRKRNRW